MAKFHDGEIDLDFLGNPDQPEQQIDEDDEEYGMDDIQDQIGDVATTEQTTNTSSTKSSSKSSSKKSPMTKSQLINTIAKRTGASLKDIKAILDSHQAVGTVGLHKNGEFKIHGLATLKTKVKEAKPARKGWNPFTKAFQTFASKPASVSVKARPDSKVKKHLKPVEKTPTWNAKDKRKLQERIQNMTIKKTMTKAQIIDHITHKSGLSRHAVNGIFDNMAELCVRELANRGSFRVPDVASLCVRERKALPEREGINPFTKEKTVFKAREATKVVKANIPKSLRSLAPAFIDHKSYSSSSSCPSKSSSQADSVSLPAFKKFDSVEI